MFTTKSKHLNVELNRLICTVPQGTHQILTFHRRSYVMLASQMFEFLKVGKEFQI